MSPTKFHHHHHHHLLQQRAESFSALTHLKQTIDQIIQLEGSPFSRSISSAAPQDATTGAISMGAQDQVERSENPPSSNLVVAVVGRKEESKPDGFQRPRRRLLPTTTHTIKANRKSFSVEQLLALEIQFSRCNYTRGFQRAQLASHLALTEAQVKIW